MNRVRTPRRRQKNIRKQQAEVTELRNIRTERKKYTLEGFDSRLDKMEEKTSELDEKALKPTQTEQQKVKRIFKNKKNPKRPRGEGGRE